MCLVVLVAVPVATYIVLNKIVSLAATVSALDVARDSSMLYHSALHYIYCTKLYYTTLYNTAIYEYNTM